MKYILIFLGLAMFTCRARGLSFSEVDSKTQSEILTQLIRAMPDTDIAIIQNRHDELYRKDQLLVIGHMVSMDMDKARLVHILKGSPPLKDYANMLIYLYWFDHHAGVVAINEGKTPYPTLYEPMYRGRDIIMLVFVRKQKEPLRNRIQDLFTREYLPFVEDGQTMPLHSFVEKYKLASVFSNRVYRLEDRCAFSVDYTVPPLVLPPEEKRMYTIDCGNLARQDPAKIRESAHLVHFSHQEVSEIVHLAYLLEGKDGQRVYDKAVEGSAILLPMKQGAYTTFIGKRLYEALKKDIEQKKNEP